MKKWFLLMTLTPMAWANLHLAPPDFDTPKGRAIFVDFIQADYQITYDLVNQTVTAKSKIIFKADKSGHPVFDLVPKAINLTLDNQKVSSSLISFPHEQSKFRLLQTEVTPGEHVLRMENTFTTNVLFREDWPAVSSAFWIRDLKDRMFLEQYVPSNFEYDQYAITLEVNFAGVEEASQDIYTNGRVTKLSPHSWKIQFPECFTVSCPFFHTTPKGWMSRMDFFYPSISGRNIPVTVYSPWRSRTKRFKKEAIRVLGELEEDYGPWGHSGLLAYGTMFGTGGMEHAGATATSFGALDHEMLHSYFAKGVMPANGNSGWIDEAIASWRDRGYPRLSHPGFSGSDLGAHSPYQRNTDKRAYGLGASFMSYLDFRLQNSGGLKAFLRGYFQAYKHTVITTEHFKNNLEFFSGLDLDEDFHTYIWGQNPAKSELPEEASPYHKPLNSQELKAIL